jgi:DNA (cytosine-5)-methyltransferase 1
MQIIDLFSGVGGFSIAGHQLGWETILFCEKEPFPQMVLRERFPGVPIFDDVCKLTGEKINGLIQSDRPIILTGGFPCQPFSVAGAREGTEDSRHLWPEMFRIIKAVRPDYIIGENVPGLLSIEGGMVFEQVCLDLESEGYEVQAFVLPACATGAPHRRDRVWIVGYNANTESKRQESFTTRAEKFQSQIRTGLFCGGSPEWDISGEDAGANGNPEHNGPPSEPELRSNEKTGNNRWQEEQTTPEQPSGADRPVDATGIYGGKVGGKRVTPDTNEIRLQLSKNTGEMGGGQREIQESRCESSITSKANGNIGVTPDTTSNGHTGGYSETRGEVGESQQRGLLESSGVNSGNYWGNWPSISPFHSGYDGISEDMVRHIRTTLAEAGETPENIEAYIRKETNWLRKQAIMAAGNAVVPTVVLQVMKAIQNHYENTND